MKRKKVIAVLMLAIGLNSNAQFNGNGSNQFSMGTNQSADYYRLFVDGSLGEYGTIRMKTNFSSDYRQSILSDVRRNKTVSYVVHNRTMSNPYVPGQSGADTYFVRGDGGVWTINGYLLYSDKRLKENIKKIDTPLEKLLKLRGVYYNLKGKKGTEFVRSRMGFIAQELRKIVPEAVVKDEKGFYAVEYTAIIPLLVEGIKKQQEEINSIKQEVLELRRLVQNSNTSIKNDSGIGEEVQSVVPLLNQNEPNPFSEKTTIKYELFEDYDKVSIRIYDLTGKQMGVKEVSNRKGKNSIEVNGSLFTPGIYIYALFVDDMEIDSKKMYITE